MSPLRRPLALGLLFTGLLWGCDATDPTQASLSALGDNEGDYEEGYTIEGSVFINDEDENVDAREPNELGIEEVRVDLFYTPNGEEYEGQEDGEDEPISVLTDEDGRYSAVVPYSGLWTVRVTADDSLDAFNPRLFASYDAVSVTERLIEVGIDDEEEGLTEEEEEAVADFAFEPDLSTVLSDLTQGPLVTSAQPLRVWRRWMRHALAERNDCPNQTNWLCRSDIEAALEAIFDAPGDDVFFGNSEPFALEEGDDPFAVANDILKSRPRTEEAELIQELLLAELNYFSGFGTPDPNYDRTLLRYLEIFVGTFGQQEARSAHLARSAAVSLQLEVARAYNRGGGGGGEVGD